MNFFVARGGKPFLVINQDPDLRPIEIPLKMPPAQEKIANWKVPKEHQKFEYQVMPNQLVRLLEANDNESPMSVKEVHEFLRLNQREYRESINWIKLQWHRLDYGYHFMNNGQWTYIDGYHYTYCNFWNINSARPDKKPNYVLRDNVYWHATSFFENDPYTIGMLYFKYRQEGATSKGCCQNYFKNIKKERQIHGIQSLSNEHVEKLWKENMMGAWKDLPFFYRPVHKGDEESPSELKFTYSTGRVKSSGPVAAVKKGLEGWITYQASPIDKYDSWTLDFYHCDEFGKKSVQSPVDSFDRWMRILPAMKHGATKRGYALFTSTIGDESQDEGGIEYAKKFWETSKYWERDDEGFTISGLVPLFIPSHINQTGFTDPYGDPLVVLDPKKGAVNMEGIVKHQDALSWIKSNRKRLEDKGQYNALNEETRKFPIYFIECFRSSGQRALFNQEITNKRVIELERMDVLNKILRTGHLVWVDNRFGGDVEFIDNSVAAVKYPHLGIGKWHLSQQPIEQIRNTRVTDHRFKMFPGCNCLVPRHPGYYSVSCDPMKFEEVSSGSKSKYSITVKRSLDSSVDHPGNEANWVSDQFVADWISDDDSLPVCNEEVLKACIYFGSYLFGENNISQANDYFRDKGFHGYRLHRILENGKIDPNPGYSTQGNSKQKMLNGLAIYIDRRGIYEKHIRILKQARDILSEKDLKNKDLLSSAMGNIEAEKQEFGKFAASTRQSKTNFNDYF